MMAKLSSNDKDCRKTGFRQERRFMTKKNGDSKSPKDWKDYFFLNAFDYEEPCISRPGSLRLSGQRFHLILQTKSKATTKSAKNSRA